MDQYVNPEGLSTLYLLAFGCHATNSDSYNLMKLTPNLYDFTLLLLFCVDDVDN